MKRLSAGVIGHVDHGKTALVRALTGIDTDRLREEKERGISIVLGFSHLALSDGEIDLIDMPGHERFVRTMVSGATGIQAVLLTVAANEGVKPQTVEHVEIAGLLGIRHGVIAITKCDLATRSEARHIAEAGLRLARDAGFHEMATVLTSARTGEGLGGLRAALGRLLEGAAEPPHHGFCYLPIDRVFAVAGFGTVVTGTLRRGRLAAGEEIEILPGRRRAQVRGLQAHNRLIAAAAPGRRIAVNLRGIDHGELRRGDAVATLGILQPSRWLDVDFRLLPSAPRPLETNADVRLLFATSEVAARVRLLDRSSLAPGARALAQLHCADEVSVPAREPFILRLASPPRTLGGGTILDPLSRRRRRYDAGILRILEITARGEVTEVIAAHLLDAGPRGCALAELARRAGHAPPHLHPWLDRLQARICADGTVLHPRLFQDLQRQALASIGDFHLACPARPGMPRSGLRAALAEGPSPAVVQEIIAALAGRAEIVIDHGLLRLGRFVPPPPDPGESELARLVAEAFRRGGLAPPDAAAVIGRDPRRRRLIDEMTRRQILVCAVDRVQKRKILFHHEAITQAKRLLAERLGSRAGGFLVREAGELLGISRKYSIPLLEHLDAIGFSRRHGDRRTLLRRVAETPRPVGRSPDAAERAVRRR